jgi:hypothetical protein
MGILAADDTVSPSGDMQSTAEGLFSVRMDSSHTYYVGAGTTRAGFVEGQTFLPDAQMGDDPRTEFSSNLPDTSISFITSFRAGDRASWSGVARDVDAGVSDSLDRAHIAMHEGAMRGRQASALRHELYRHSLTASFGWGPVWHSPEEVHGLGGITTSPFDVGFANRISQRLSVDSCVDTHGGCD